MFDLVGWELVDLLKWVDHCGSTAEQDGNDGLWEFCNSPSEVEVNSLGINSPDGISAGRSEAIRARIFHSKGPSIFNETASLRSVKMNMFEKNRFLGCLVSTT